MTNGCCILVTPITGEQESICWWLACEGGGGKQGGDWFIDDTWCIQATSGCRFTLKEWKGWKTLVGSGFLELGIYNSGVLRMLTKYGIWWKFRFSIVGPMLGWVLWIKKYFESWLIHHLLSAKIFSIWRSSKLKRVNELDVVHLASWVWRSIVSNMVVLTYFTWPSKQENYLRPELCACLWQQISTAYCFVGGW